MADNIKITFMIHFLGVSINLFLLGILGIFFNRRSIILMLLSIELILLAVNFNFLVFASFLDDLLGQLFALFVLTVAAAESSIGLAILVADYQISGTVSVEYLNLGKNGFYYVWGDLVEEALKLFPQGELSGHNGSAGSAGGPSDGESPKPFKGDPEKPSPAGSAGGTSEGSAGGTSDGESPESSPKPVSRQRELAKEVDLVKEAVDASELRYVIPEDELDGSDMEITPSKELTYVISSEYLAQVCAKYMHSPTQRNFLGWYLLSKDTLGERVDETRELFNFLVIMERRFASTVCLNRGELLYTQAETRKTVNLIHSLVNYWDQKRPLSVLEEIAPGHEKLVGDVGATDNSALSRQQVIQALVDGGDGFDTEKQSYVTYKKRLKLPEEEFITNAGLTVETMSSPLDLPGSISPCTPMKVSAHAHALGERLSLEERQLEVLSRFVIKSRTPQDVSVVTPSAKKRLEF